MVGSHSELQIVTFVLYMFPMYFWGKIDVNILYIAQNSWFLIYIHGRLAL